MSDYKLGIKNDRLRVLLNDYENELSRTKREAKDKIQDLEAKLGATKKEYAFFVSGFDNFFKFMQEHYSDVCYIGNTHQDNAIKVIKDLEGKLTRTKDEVQRFRNFLSNIYNGKANLDSTVINQMIRQRESFLNSLAEISEKGE